jgi:hypothetical protein
MPSLVGVSESQPGDLQRSRWTAPELIDPRISEADLGSQHLHAPRLSSDVYSFGMTMLEVRLLLSLLA